MSMTWGKEKQESATCSSRSRVRCLPPACRSTSSPGVASHYPVITTSLPVHSNSSRRSTRPRCALLRKIRPVLPPDLLAAPGGPLDSQWLDVYLAGVSLDDDVSTLA